ncbi:MAG: DUF1738 domain-containing protein [Bacteroidales bacterium]|nr:DUF1738 domain-containing protein [Bacteroidales bacterium]MBQ7019254.1 DUF1738 domain-containing protein [Bacteroidales bacterium]
MNKTLEKLAEAYTSALMEKFNDELFWEKPWFNVSAYPVNLRGTGYRGANLFLLSLAMDMKGYGLPVYLTYNQAQKLGVSILKGQRGWPVQHYICYHKDENGKYIPDDQFQKMTKEQQEQCTTKVKLSYYVVFNICQTNMQEVRPEIYDKFQQKFCVTNMVQGESHVMLDKQLQGDWICPIHEQRSNQAYYAPKDNHIVLPLREQFSQMAQFYSTALHEMAHSTMHPDACPRKTKAPERVDSYGHEELIAELSAGLTGLSIGVEQTPQQNNIAYLKCWLENMKQDPQYIFNVLADAKAVTQFMTGHFGLEIGQNQKEEMDDISIPEDLKHDKKKNLKL